MTTGTGRTRAVDELAELVRPFGRAVAGRLPEIVAGLAAVLTLLAALALGGAALDDRTIAAHRMVAQAEVLDGSTFARTLVRFTVAGGEAVVPERGVFHPRGLRAGDTVTVEYATTDPELVRVAGRTALDRIVPLLAGVVAVWAVLGPVALWLRRRRAR